MLAPGAYDACGLLICGNGEDKSLSWWFIPLSTEKPPRAAEEASVGLKFLLRLEDIVTEPEKYDRQQL